jgi:hypothetical protein
VTPEWDTAWTIGPSSAEAILMPGAMAADARQVYVLDLGVALRSKDGSVAWSAGRTGSGPGEFRQTVHVNVMPSGEIAVVDEAARRLSVFSQE